ncbi:hypothetical protein [Hyphomicrobium sp.]|uniref:hypothetical protein n=1 Tax=Hyphomicrobium sp. TaxID=82 RepID=UPI0025C33270|nr:hypothetical protein [Hyphomicrobium sp.]MCC7254186.1 hypothetical protein [Hyphomicrobium sp.]
MILKNAMFAGLALMAVSSDAVAKVYPGRQSCPLQSPQNSWPDYLSGKFGDRTRYFSVRMTRNVGGYLVKNYCYTVIYAGNGVWTASGHFINGQGRNEAANHNTKGGLPENYQMQIWHYAFTFNEAGEVYFAGDNKLAGQMYCRIGSECWK